MNHEDQFLTEKPSDLALAIVDLDSGPLPNEKTFVRTIGAKVHASLTFFNASRFHIEA